MPTPLLLGILALGALALSCDKVKEPEPQKPQKNIKTEPEPPRCPGDSYVLPFEGEKLTLCRDKKNNIWDFLPQNPWDQEAERLFSKGVEFSRSRNLDVNEVTQLAAKIRPPPSQPALSLKEKAYAIAIAAVLLSVRRGGENSFYQAHRKFIDTVIQKMDEGKLRLKNAYQKREDPEPVPLAQYTLSDNTFLVLVDDLDLDKTTDRGIILHELNHFFQDIEQKKISTVDSEVESYLVEADYLLHEEGLLEEKISPQDLDSFISRKIPAHSIDPHLPIPKALRAEFYRHRGDRVNYEKWLETCRQDSDVTISHRGILLILNSLRGPAKDQMATTKFQEKYSELEEKDPQAFLKVWEREIQSFRTDKKREFSKMQNLLALPNTSQVALLFQYYRLLQKTVDVILMERLKLRSQRKKVPSSGRERRIPVQTKEQNYTRVAEELARLGANRAILISTDGVD